VFDSYQWHLQESSRTSSSIVFWMHTQVKTCHVILKRTGFFYMWNNSTHLFLTQILMILYGVWN
jgi:hypothetical protein